MSNKKFKLNDFSLQGFGSRLKKARRQLGLNPSQMSDIIGVEKNSYYKYEDGSRFPKPEILSALITYLNLNVNFLISGEGEMFLTAPLEALFPNIPPETYPLIESLEVPIMKHSLMTEYLLCKEQYKSFIDEYFKKKGRTK
jgi:transcriptional regulator with XRE-family HTH domain